MFRRLIITTAFVISALSGFTQELPGIFWQAQWITCPGIEQKAYGVYHFRRQFELAKTPEKFVIHVSADNRYKLFVNGHQVGLGPARGHLSSWYYETYDIAPWLKAGSNTIAALVWNMGEHAPVAQISNQTGFILQGEGPAEALLNSDNSWKVYQNPAYTPCATDIGAVLRSYVVVGPGDRVEAANYPYGWEQPSYNDSHWASARSLCPGYPVGAGTDNLWTLKPRTIPLMGMEKLPQASIRRTTGLKTPLPTDFPISIPANTTARIVLDQGFLTIGYPALTTSGGQGGEVKITYAEAPMKDHQKGHRNELGDLSIIGNYDIFLPDGGAQRIFSPLWLRTYRYVELHISTKDQPLTIDSWQGTFSSYPFEQKAVFSSSDASLQQIWDTGWRTARLCAGETYFDCPYYEQLQYVGDTRIQALISLYVAGDDRLVRKALDDFFQSLTPEGITQSRFPSNRYQIIPTYSLFWVSMVYDYWMLRSDDKLIRSYLPAITRILDWYGQYIDPETQMLGAVPWWNFVDWADPWSWGIPPGGSNGGSSITTLQLAYTLNQAAPLYDYYQQTAQAQQCRQLARQLIEGVKTQCYDADKNWIADTPAKTSFSQHANIMAVLTGLVPEAEQAATVKRIQEDASLTQATFYYRFYLTQAMRQAGLAEQYYASLKPWRQMLDIGLSTFAEKPEPTRSDCHAWSASPNYDLLATLCGIQPDAPGFSNVLISPALGGLSHVRAQMPHPAGTISLNLHATTKGGLSGEITLPPGINGRMVWGGRSISLHPGLQKVSF